MNILKFGGTSVGTAERMKALVKLITGPDRKIVVLSAMSGTTNTLVEICQALYQKEKEWLKAIDVTQRLTAISGQPHGKEAAFFITQIIVTPRVH